MSNFLIDEDTGLLAAEFVLGTLDSEERASAQSLLRTDHGFIAMVRIWERRFGELHLMVEPVEPDPKLFQRIKAKVAEIPRAAEQRSQPAGATVSATASPPKAEAPQPAETPPGGELNGEPPKPPDAPAPAIPQDAPVGETTATDATETPPESPPGPDAPGEIAPSTPEVPAERGPAADKVATPTPPPLRERPARAPETIAVMRSRGRWRIFGLCMTLLVVGLVALLAAWRFIPDRLPARLRPAQLMTSIGIQTLLPRAAAPVLKPPEGQFDE